MFILKNLFVSIKFVSKSSIVEILGVVAKNWLKNKLPKNNY